ncbi:hypothetical protein XAC3810_530299 [Xanthomonas citri pv. citri]|uniref:Uncharacterized protein n=1 Tax=Xanthomonas citri pv. citri TaxID=611301 RepID=A0A0U5FIG4_XANCI|nr:hypothetical protein XAC9322_530295 [Xanthomonas citri pv. citri]CEE33489.1 hypothetical protein XAC3824_690095 [Xanthomonas citri pv. citri]CEE34562.1 hypothetical protein XAC1083_530272 [Xanthomonas citri pv. citri]CEE43901.1 hypothetical protein XAC3810_530299 [Xanthomonas citri pv. citri]CEE45356.1 hypothetical protein XAC902_720121 [Xanthomonas citri pv. citri]
MRRAQHQGTAVYVLAARPRESLRNAFDGAPAQIGTVRYRCNGKRRARRRRQTLLH